jgi:hypothetical protein
VYKLAVADRLANRAAAKAAAEAARAPKVAAATDHAVGVQALLARIPVAAFETPLAEVGISARVQSHLEKANLLNVGQVLQRMAEGEEAMLLIDGIGPKALAEVKAQIEAKGLSFMPPAAPPAPAPVEPAASTAPVEAPVTPETPVAVETVQPAAVQEAPQPVEQAQAVAPVAAAPDAPVAPVLAPVEPVPPELIESLVEEEGEDEGGIGKKKDKKDKGRKLVFDERRGAVVSKRERKPGRVRNAWEVGEEET